MRATRLLLGIALVTMSIAAVAAGSVAAGDEADLASRCKGYQMQLLRARSALERGDRRSAIAALKDARSALRSCANQEEARGQTILSAVRPAVRAG